ncbi:Calx-beta domain-containing protein, partial [Carboxylicivirga marina]|uniref:Calx-beta domain-containing protein n=2 Tax=Carboxylicivirga TaxID=1628153 RepID=UPI003D32565E
SATIPVTVTTDALVEGNETVIITLNTQTNANAEIGSSNSATVNITDNDKSVISIDATTQAEEDNTNGLFTINITPALVGPATINYTVSGTAQNGTDYSTITSSIDLNTGATSATIPVTVTTDALVEGNETVIITLNTQTNANAEIGSSNSATVNITDNDKSVISIDATTQAEEDNTDGLFTINITPALVGPATINYTVSGTAQNGTDYST